MPAGFFKYPSLASSFSCWIQLSAISFVHCIDLFRKDEWVTRADTAGWQNIKLQCQVSVNFVFFNGQPVRMKKWKSGNQLIIWWVSSLSMHRLDNQSINQSNNRSINWLCITNMSIKYSINRLGCTLWFAHAIKHFPESISIKWHFRFGTEQQLIIKYCLLRCL